MTTNSSAKRSPLDVRIDAAKLSADGPPQASRPNGDENAPYIFSFTKGLAHGLNGLMVEPGDFEDFKDGTESPDPFTFAKATPFVGEFFTPEANNLETGEEYREWESPTAGHAYTLEGPDPQSIPMPPAPKAGSTEFAAEIAEVYQMALARDWSVTGFMPASLINDLEKLDGTPASQSQIKHVKAINKEVTSVASRLGDLRWFKGEKTSKDTSETLQRHRRRFGQKPTENTIFRGKGEDPWATPFLSQFMIMGSGGGARSFQARASGEITFGAQFINQDVRLAHPGKDYMTKWPEYVDVQNRANIRKKFSKDEIVQGVRRPIATLRDMAAYVHDDALYQAYFNAALILLDEGFALDSGLPYHSNSDTEVSRDTQDGFALFGGPHLLDLVASISVPALKSVRYQKFTVHRRLRPEAAGALFHTILTGFKPHRDLANDPKLGKFVKEYAEGDGSPEAKARRMLGRTLAGYIDGPGASKTGSEPALVSILEDIREHNALQNGEDPKKLNVAKWLLPMAFAEGSPMHPSYGAGHATVAGACVTLLKAFFAMTEVDHHGNETPVHIVKPGERALVPEAPTSLNDKNVGRLGLPIKEGLTLEGELNKLIWNVSNARNMGGVHYYTDYIESALLGEAITIGILREQMLNYDGRENVSMTVPLIVPRKLPEALLTGQSTLTSDDVVKRVLIRRDGSIAAA